MKKGKIILFLLVGLFFSINIKPSIPFPGDPSIGPTSIKLDPGKYRLSPGNGATTPPFIIEVKKDNTFIDYTGREYEFYYPGMGEKSYISYSQPRHKYVFRENGEYEYYYEKNGRFHLVESGTYRKLWKNISLSFFKTNEKKI